MGFKDREIEKKLSTYSVSFDSVQAAINSVFGTPKVDNRSGIDVYWPIKDTPTAFGRLREDERGLQFTVKNEDKGNSFDRVEIDIDLASNTSIYSALAYQELLLGPSNGTLEKPRYSVWQIGSNKYNTISCCTVKLNGTDLDGVFVEAEGVSLDLVSQYVEQLKLVIPSLVEVEGSFYTTYIKPRLKVYQDI